MTTADTSRSEVLVLAERQRHAALVEKVAAGTILSRSELAELARFEQDRPAASALPPNQRRGRRSRRVSMAEVRMLGLAAESLTEAAAAFSGPGDLVKQIERREAVRAAWERGRLLRGVRRLAGTIVTVSQAGKELGMTGLEFRALLDGDTEVRDLWDQQRQALYVRTAEGTVAQAGEGKAHAMRLVANFLRSEKAPAGGFDHEHVPIGTMVEITGKSRQTLHAWTTTAGLPRNPDCSYNLAEFVAWFERAIKSQSRGGPRPDALREQNAARVRMENQVRRGELIERAAIENGLVARMQNFLAAIDNYVGPAAAACVGRDIEAIEAEIRAFCGHLRGALAEIPTELRLDGERADEFERFLGRLEAPPAEGPADAT